MILSHRIALDPTARRRKLLARTCGVARFTYNWALAAWKAQYEAGGKPNALALKKQFNAIKRVEFPFVTEVTKCSAESAFDNLGSAFRNFFRRVKAGQKKPGYPRFKKRGVSRDSFGVANDKFRFDGKRVNLPRIGWVRTREPLRFTGKIMGATISRTADRWFIAVQVEVGEVAAKPKNRGLAVGIDLGLTTFATIHDGKTTEKIEAPKPLKKSLKRLRRAQRRLSRRFKKGAKRQSGRYMRQKQRLQRLHARVSSVRSDFLHKLSHRLARTTRVVVTEDLAIRGMVRNRRLARAISDASWGEFVRQLAYKCPLYGSELRKIDRFAPSSKTCSNCGAAKASLALSERTFACSACGLVADRDENAAKNVRTAGLAGTYARGPEGSGRRKATKPRRVEAGTTPRISNAYS